MTLLGILKFSINLLPSHSAGKETPVCSEQGYNNYLSAVHTYLSKSKGFYFNLISSLMSYSALSDSCEYLWYRSTRLRPLEICLLLQCGERLKTSESDVYRRQILTTKVAPRAVRVKTSSIINPKQNQLIQKIHLKKINMHDILFSRELAFALLNCLLVLSFIRSWNC